ncbi:transposase family protein [Leptodesmis sichuanensis A121]|nr:transposase family protein [Leptodesmis sichuanensis A121]
MLNQESSCPHCKKLSSELHQNRPILIRDLSIFGQVTYLKIPRRQFYCRDCQRYFTRVNASKIWSGMCLRLRHTGAENLQHKLVV